MDSSASNAPSIPAPAWIEMRRLHSPLSAEQPAGIAPAFQEWRS